MVHEAGHGLYEQGLTGKIEGTFCGHATSLGLHESQSRFWENMVGRSHAFWERHLAWMAAAGTTTAEVKSGYGLDHDTELAMLDAVRAPHAIETAATFQRPRSRYTATARRAVPAGR